MKTTEYTIKITTWPTEEDYEENVLKVMRDTSGVDRALMFLSPSENKSKIYIPLGPENNEPGSGVRELHWIEKDKIISITPSILVRGGGHEHFYIVNNKVMY